MNTPQQAHPSWNELASFDLGQVKILDFGLARWTDESDAGAAQTPDGSIVGTPAYTAPEQARAPKTADIRADLYSLGCTCFSAR